jgi:anti-sigma factor RsiW
MSCGQIDLKGYLLGEIAREERQAVEAHAAACVACREELERLRLTTGLLRSLTDEEIPRRIAFVSDKVLAPGWWARLWQSGPRLGFASAALLAAAILVHAWLRPAVVAPPPAVDRAAVEAIVEREVARRLDEAVARAAAVWEARENERRAQLLRQVREEFEMGRREERAQIEQAFEVLHKRLNVMHLASAWRAEER